MNPPMSVVHQGMPARPMFSPACSCSRRAWKVLGTSPDQITLPYFWLPAQPHRSRFTGGSFLSASMGSKNARENICGYMLLQLSAGPAQ